jgi:hypothetical protein
LKGLACSRKSQPLLCMHAEAGCHWNWSIGPGTITGSTPLDGQTAHPRQAGAAPTQHGGQIVGGAFAIAWPGDWSNKATRSGPSATFQVVKCDLARSGLAAPGIGMQLLHRRGMPKHGHRSVDSIQIQRNHLRAFWKVCCFRYLRCSAGAAQAKNTGTKTNRRRDR